MRGLLQTAAIALLSVLFVDLSRRPAVAGPVDELMLLCVCSHVGLFAVSTAYHCVPWPPLAKARMQRADHAMIYLKIAGSIGPFAWVAFSADQALFWIGLSWSIALVGVAQKLFLPRFPPRISSYVQVVQALLILPAISELSVRGQSELGPALVLSSLLYAIGGLVFLLERPRLWPGRYSYHELFHTLVVLGGVSLSAALLSLSG